MFKSACVVAVVALLVLMVNADGGEDKRIVGPSKGLRGASSALALDDDRLLLNFAEVHTSMQGKKKKKKKKKKKVIKKKKRNASDMFTGETLGAGD